MLTLQVELVFIQCFNYMEFEYGINTCPTCDVTFLLKGYKMLNFLFV